MMYQVLYSRKLHAAFTLRELCGTLNIHLSPVRVYGYIADC